MSFTTEEKKRLRDYSKEIMGGRELPQAVEQQQREIAQQKHWEGGVK